MFRIKVSCTNTTKCSQSLSGHDSRLTSLALLADNKKLLSVDDHGHLVCWDLTAKRNVTPPWKEANNCNLCDTPFFWNVKEMWERKVSPGR